MLRPLHMWDIRTHSFTSPVNDSDSDDQLNFNSLHAPACIYSAVWRRRDGDGVKGLGPMSGRGPQKFQLISIDYYRKPAVQQIYISIN